MTWRAFAPKVSEAVLRSCDVWGVTGSAKLELAAPAIAMIAVLPPAAKILRLDILWAFSLLIVHLLIAHCV